MKKLLLCASAFALMLGSCSKDDTEVAPIEVKGKAAFSASMTIGDGVSTRTHVGAVVDGEDRYYRYYWDKGDAIGASALTNASAVIPFVVDESQLPEGEDVASVNFYPLSEDLAYFGEQPIYLAYPYDKSVHVGGSDEAPTIDMTIPATQLYRTNSFATMTAPAVGVIMPEDIKDGQIPDITMEPVASYVRFGVVGSGKLTKISLSVKNPDGNYYVLNGSAAVSLKDGGYALNLNTTTPSSASAEAANINTIDFGNGGFDLDYVEPTYLWFVVPADITFSKSTLTFTATVDGSQSVVEKTYKGDDVITRNMVLDIPVNIELGMEDKVLIENNADLLEYLYTVSKGTDGDKTAVLVNDINFSRYDARNDINGAEGNMLAALTEYLTNGSAINSIAEGAKIDGNGHIISNLQVSGNGIFAGQPDALKNLTLSAVTVNVPDEANPALFVGNINLYDCSDGLAINRGYLKNVAEDATAALIHTAYLTTLPSKDKVTISYPRVNESSVEAYYASKLNLKDNVDANGDLKAYFNSATPRFGAIVAGDKDVAISKVSSAYVKGLLDAIQYGVGSKAISVIDSKGTSYWTGGVASAAPANGEVKTAEQLAYYVKNGGTATLAANIDLQGIDLQGEQGKEWVLDNGSAALNITGNGKYTISNALVKSQKVTEPYVAYSLLGNLVNAKDIVVDGVTIDVDNVEGSTAQLYVGGIGYQGSANGVKVSNLTIDIAEDVKVSRYNEVGGLISAPTAASEKNAVTDLSINVNGNETVGPVGCLFGKAPASFNGNALTWSEGATATGAMIGAWTVTDDFADDKAVVDCNAGEAPIVDILTVDAANGGQTLVLEFKDCSEKIYNEIVNPNSYTTTIKLNGKLQEVAPTK